MAVINVDPFTQIVRMPSQSICPFGEYSVDPFADFSANYDWPKSTYFFNVAIYERGTQLGMVPMTGTETVSVSGIHKETYTNMPIPFFVSQAFYSNIEGISGVAGSPYGKGNPPTLLDPSEQPPPAPNEPPPPPKKFPINWGCMPHLVVVTSVDKNTGLEVRELNLVLVNATVTLESLDALSGQEIWKIETQQENGIYGASLLCDVANKQSCLVQYAKEGSYRPEMWYPAGPYLRVINSISLSLYPTGIIV